MRPNAVCMSCWEDTVSGTRSWKMKSLPEFYPLHECLFDFHEDPSAQLHGSRYTYTTKTKLYSYHYNSLQIKHILIHTFNMIVVSAKN